MLFDYGFVLPALVATVIGLAALSRKGDRMPIWFMGSLAVIIVGAATTFFLADRLIEVSAHAPYELFIEAWRRVWYPLAVGIIAAIAFAVIALWPRRSVEA